MVQVHPVPFFIFTNHPFFETNGFSDRSRGSRDRSLGLGNETDGKLRYHFTMFMGYTPEYIYMLERKKTKSPEMGVIYQFLIINGWCNISGEMGLEATIITRNGRYIFNFINPPQLEVVYSVYCITDLME